MVVDGLQLFSFWCGKFEFEVHVLWLIIGLKNMCHFVNELVKPKPFKTHIFLNFDFYTVLL